VRERARTLTSDKIAIRRRDTSLASTNQIAVRTDAHRTSRLAPFKAGVDEDVIEPFPFGMTFDVD
jgi:hypothetical protein